MGVLIDQIRFVHAQDLLLIVDTLRKQLLFNELLLSCMRKHHLSSPPSHHANTVGNKSEMRREAARRIVEIGLVAPLVVSLIMQHPRLHSYTTMELDVGARGRCVETRFRDHNDLHNPHVISEIVRRCHSIPVTIRALMCKYKQTAAIDDNRPAGSGFNGHGSGNGNAHAGSNNNNRSDMDRSSSSASRFGGG